MYHSKPYFVEYICQSNHSFSDGSVYLNISCQDGGELAWEPLTDNCSGIILLDLVFYFHLLLAMSGLALS